MQVKQFDASLLKAGTAKSRNKIEYNQQILLSLFYKSDLYTGSIYMCMKVQTAFFPGMFN